MTQPYNRNMTQTKPEVDNEAYVASNDILSNEPDNLLGISPVDGKVMLGEDSLRGLIRSTRRGCVPIYDCGDEIVVRVRKSDIEAYEDSGNRLTGVMLGNAGIYETVITPTGGAAHHVSLSYDFLPSDYAEALRNREYAPDAQQFIIPKNITTINGEEVVPVQLSCFCNRKIGPGPMRSPAKEPLREPIFEEVPTLGRWALVDCLGNGDEEYDGREIVIKPAT